MQEKLCICLRCMHKFLVETINSKEAERENIPIVPVRCRQCKSTDVKDSDELN